MRLLINILVVSMLFLDVGFSLSYAGRCGDCQKGKKCEAVCVKCCDNMGGVQYCDSSAGRLVCKNGYYSSCYCTRHAVMDLQKVEGCCLWQGGILTISTSGQVMCNDGGVSELCSTANTISAPHTAW